MMGLLIAAYITDLDDVSGSVLAVPWSTSMMSKIFGKVLYPAVREVRFLLSQNGQASSGARNFILANYPAIKKHNQDLPVLIREAEGTPARAFARFERGVEKHVELDNLSLTEVESKVAQLLGLKQ